MKIIILGCGIMGRSIAAAISSKRSFEVVGALDIDPDLVGKDLGELFQPARPTGIFIERDPAALFERTRADAVVLATQSHLTEVDAHISQCVSAGINVVSTCEELAYPWKRHPQLAARIDESAKRGGVTVVGTGINPGFLMDALPLILTAPCLHVDSIRVTRMMNSARRRLPFQVKVGTGLIPDDFRRRIDSGLITGHVGLLESIHMMAGGLGWELEEAVELPPEAVIAREPTDSGLGVVPAGHVIGLMSAAHGVKGAERVISLEFVAHAGVEEEFDEIVIGGEPRIHQKILGGVHGDTGTVAVTVNTIPRAVQASPGLKVMSELPPPCTVP
jgi:4-hydroxy-tetrahydrodipicolinate reductase